LFPHSKNQAVTTPKVKKEYSYLCSGIGAFSDVEVGGFVLAKSEIRFVFLVVISGPAWIFARASDAFLIEEVVKEFG
jgi:hypothetical protein